MTYTITYKCEWCGKEHTDGSNEIKGHRGSTCDFKLGDLCDPCYKEISRALKTRSDIHTGHAITFNVWIGSVFTALALGAYICFAVMS